MTDEDLQDPKTVGDLREAHVLEDGTRVELRPIRPEDAPLLRRGFDELSPESRYRRFFGGVQHLNDTLVRYLTEVDGEHHVAIVATVESPDLKTERGVGIARFVRVEGQPDTAEAAVTVVDDMQRKGVGRLMLARLAAEARARGIRRFRADVLASNEPMRHLLLEADAQIVQEDGGVLTVDVPLEDPPHAASSRGILLRLFRLAASQMAVLVRRLAPTGEDEKS